MIFSDFIEILIANGIEYSNNLYYSKLNEIFKELDYDETIRYLNNYHQQYTKEDLTTLKGLYLACSAIEKIENLRPLHSLKLLYLNNNKIKKIENLPESLTHLYLSNNKIKKIENLPDSLISLFLEGNKIKILESNSLPNSLTHLDLSYNPIVDIPEEYISIIYFEK